MKSLKVWHINNIAEVGPILVGPLKRLGLDVEFHDVAKPLAGYPLVFKIFGLLTRIRGARALLKKARAERVDILHVHYSTTAIWFLFGGLPIVVHVHGGDARLRWWNGLGHLINWVVCKNAAAIFYSTPDMDQHLRRYTARAQFSPNPIDLDVFTPQGLERNKNLIFLNLALRHVKGADLVFTAVKQLKAKYPQLHFQTFGFGDMIEEARTFGIEILARVGREKLPAILSQAGLIIGQMRLGAVGMSELEDLALGRTAVCHFEYAHIYAEAPPFVQAETVDEIVAAVEKYVKDNNTYAPLETKARDWVVKFHDANQSAKNLVSEYRKITSLL